MPQHREVVRHGVVGEAEENAIEWLGCDVFGRIALGELDIAQPLALAELACSCQHAGRQIDPVDRAGGADRVAQEREISPGAAPDLEHAGAGSYGKALGGKAAQMRGKKNTRSNKPIRPAIRS